MKREREEMEGGEESKVCESEGYIVNTGWLRLVYPHGRLGFIFKHKYKRTKKKKQIRKSRLISSYNQFTTKLKGSFTLNLPNTYYIPVNSVLLKFSLNERAKA